MTARREEIGRFRPEDGAYGDRLPPRCAPPGAPIVDFGNGFVIDRERRRRGYREAEPMLRMRALGMVVALLSMPKAP